MKYFFKEHEDTPLCSKGFYSNPTGHVTFAVEYGVAELPDEPVDAALTGKVRHRAERHRQLRIEARDAAVRELGGVPYTDEKTQIKTEVGKSSKGGKS